MIVCMSREAAEPDWSDMVWEHGGKSYTTAEANSAPTTRMADTPFSSCLWYSRISNASLLPVCLFREAAEPDWSDMVWEHGGKSYTFHSCRTDYPKISYLYFYVVVPDEAVADMECVEESRAYLTEKQRFDGIGLHRELSIMNCPSSATGSAPRGAINALKSLTGMKLSLGAIRSSYHPVRL